MSRIRDLGNAHAFFSDPVHITQNETSSFQIICCIYI